MLACAALASCAQPKPNPEPAKPASVDSTAPADSAQLASELRALIGPAACSSDAQCRTVAIGAKACGGPSAYLAWSTRNTDAERVAALARRQSEAQHRELVSSGMRSTCSVVSDPGASCFAGRCQLVASAAAR